MAVLTETQSTSKQPPEQPVRVIGEDRKFIPKHPRMPELTKAEMTRDTPENKALLVKLVMIFASEVQEQQFSQQGDTTKFFKVIAENGVEKIVPRSFQEMAKVEGTEQRAIVAAARILYGLQRLKVDIRRFTKLLSDEKITLKAGPESASHLLDLEYKSAQLRGAYSSLEAQVALMRFNNPQIDAAIQGLTAIRTAVEIDIAPAFAVAEDGMAIDSNVLFYEGLRRLVNLNQ